VVYKTITVIGLGTLGGFVADAISNLEGVEKLIIIDHDIVESKNLKNSIYRQIDIGLSKTEALKDIILSKEQDTNIDIKSEKYIEGEMKLPKSDLVLDCRDVTYNRDSEIDARLYISSRYLIVDCRKNVIYPDRRVGKYLVELSKDDLRYAASIISMAIYSGTITSLLRSQSVQKYEIDYVKHIDNYKCDLVYENLVDEEKFVNLPDKIVPILELNKRSDVTVFLGSKVFPITERIIPKNTLQTSGDVISNLTSVATSQCEFNHFVVALFQENNHVFVELIPETGAA
jgi:hypothetical protein